MKYVLPAICLIGGMVGCAFGGYLLYDMLTADSMEQVVWENSIGKSPKPILFASKIILLGVVMLIAGFFKYKQESKKDTP